MHKISIKTKLALIIALFFWASAFVGIRIGLQDYPPGGLALFRFLVASLCMFFIYVRLPARNKIAKTDIGWLLLVGAFGIGGYHIALNYGELSVASGIAGFIVSLSPVVTAVFAVVFLRERLSVYGIVGMIISILGVMLIMLGQNNVFRFDIGIIYVLCAAFVGGVYSVLQKPFLKKYNVIEVTTYVIWGGTLALLIYLPDLLHGFAIAPLKVELTAIYLGIFPSAIAYVAWGYVLTQMPASRAVNFYYFLPIIATLLGWMCLGEMPALLSLEGGMIALLGVWVVNHSYRKQAIAYNEQQ